MYRAWRGRSLKKCEVGRCGCGGSHLGGFSFKVVRHSERGFSFGQVLSECLGLLGPVAGK